MVDGLCRMQLEARRRGYRIVVHGPCDALRELIEFLGLQEVLLGEELTVVSEHGPSEPPPATRRD
jgi:hypothetical protein